MAGVKGMTVYAALVVSPTLHAASGKQPSSFGLTDVYVYVCMYVCMQEEGE